MTDYEHIPLQILFHDKPPFLRIRSSAKSQSSALTESIIHQAFVSAHLVASDIDDISRGSGKVSGQKLSELPFSYETYARTVLLLGNAQSVFKRYLSYFALEQSRKRKNHVFKLLSGYFT